MAQRTRSQTAAVYAALADARARLVASDHAILGSQIAVSEIAAPTGAEGERAAWVASRFTALGLCDVRTDGAGNVIGRRPGARDRAAVVVCAHLDTVFPRGTALHVRRDGPRLEGPGIGDNGRGIAAMLALAEQIDGTRLRTEAPIDFVATTGEEGLGDLRGARAFFADAASRTAAVVALDGAGDERVVHRGLGSRRYRVTFRGTGGHSWAAYGVANPVHAAAAAVAGIRAIVVPREPRTTLSVGRIGGGISVNAIPEDGWFELDLRSASPTLLQRFDQDVRAAVRAAETSENSRRTASTRPLVVTVDVIGDRPGGEIPADDPLVVTAIDATRLVGREPDLATASTDANVPISLGIPSIALGAGGRGGDTHTMGEWYDNTDGTIGLTRALTVVVAAAGLVQT
jgi:acetylornithine deacetylase/succinyl-diaminopimelate desuccinylase-like protein